jgi:hypothetical protein
MAEKGKITARLTATAHTLLQQAAQERSCSQSEVIETALLAFLAPKEGEAMADLMMQKLVNIEEAMEAMYRVFKTLVPLPSTNPEARPPIATYEQMYGPIDAASVPEAAEPAPETMRHARPGRLRRWLFKEDPT